MNRIILTILFAIGTLAAMLIETTIIAIPLVYLIGAFFLVFVRHVRIYILVFILAFFTDSLRVSNFGLTPIFLTVLCTIIFLYEKYSGSDDKLISSVFICASGIIYAHYLSYSIYLTLLLIGISGACWYVVNYLQRRGTLNI